LKGSVIRYILDSTAFYAGLHLQAIEIFTTEEVIKEVKHIKSKYNILETLIQTSSLKIINPSEPYIAKAKELAMQSNELDKLSMADLSIIALALELNYEVITDDYAITNILKRNNIKVINLYNKIRKVGKWIKYCKYCNIDYSNDNICERCGNKLSRKLISESSNHIVNH
jgi:UPF0271 protein